DSRGAQRASSRRRPAAVPSTAPLFPFGFGLSYTKFEIGAPRLSSAKIGIAASVTVSVDIANVGARAGDEVVQLYVRDQVSSVARPILELKGFERVTLAPGERRTVQFTLGPDAFRFFDITMREVVEPGLFDISVGADSTRLKTVILEIA
ncbi:MAG: beta-glucosidase, partial [Sphingomonas sp.]